MKIMKFIAVFALLFCVLVQSVGCAPKKQTLRVYNWGEYMDEEAIKKFETEFDCSVIYETYESNEAMYAKVKASPADYDVLVPTDFMCEQMIKEGLLEKLDMKNIPNYGNLFNRFEKTVHDPNGEYLVPYLWGTFGIIYNKKLVTEKIDSWDVLWDPKYKGQIYIYTSMRDVIGFSLKRLGYSLNTRSVEEVQKAKEELIKQKPNTEGYVSDLVKQKMASGEAAICVSYSGDALFSKFDNPDVEYVIPKEGTNLWYDAMVIAKGSKNKALGEKFINFMLEPKNAAMNADYTGYSTCNEACIPFVNPELTSDHIFMPTEEELKPCEMFHDLGDFRVEFSKAWEEIMVAR